jgi:thioredoxin reductase (NADPH)
VSTPGADPAPDATVALAIVGAGPCGLAVAVAAQAAGVSAVTFDRGCLVSGIAQYPPYMQFFSTAERLEVGGVPFVVAAEKPTRRDALAYYRLVATRHRLALRLYEGVERLAPAAGGGWLVHSRTRHGAARVTRAGGVVLATGYFGRPSRLGVPGETLPHVRHGYTEGHEAWGAEVVVVGGGNSAVDAALDMWRAGGRVTLVHFADALDAGVKPWVRPEIEARIRDGSIAARFGSRVVAIEPDGVVLEGPDGRARVAASQVHTMTGYLPETALLAAAGVPVDPETGIPAHDPATMATPVEGLYLAGVIASGNRANRIFIETGRDHGAAIVSHWRSRAPVHSPSPVP